MTALYIQINTFPISLILTVRLTYRKYMEAMREAEKVSGSCHLLKNFPYITKCDATLVSMTTNYRHEAIMHTISHMHCVLGLNTNRVVKNDKFFEKLLFSGSDYF